MWCRFEVNIGPYINTSGCFTIIVSVTENIHLRKLCCCVHLFAQWRESEFQFCTKHDRQRFSIYTIYHKLYLDQYPFCTSQEFVARIYNLINTILKTLQIAILTASYSTLFSYRITNLCKNAKNSLTEKYEAKWRVQLKNICQWR